MHSPNLIPRVILALIASLAGAACSDGIPTQASAPGPLSTIAAHSPSHLKSSGTVGFTSTPPAYTQLDAASAGGSGGALSLAVDVQGEIPRFPDSYMQSVAVFGYAWLNASLTGVVAVIHPVIGADSRQNPAGWHTHPVQLAGGTAASDLCVASIGTSEGGISIQGDGLGLQMSQNLAGVAGGDLAIAAAFIVQGDPGCTSGLGVHVLSAKGL